MVNTIICWICAFVLIGTQLDLNYGVDYDKSSIKFSIGHAGMTANGIFEKFEVEKLVFDPNNLQSAHLKATINSASIDTGIGLRDKELRGKSYLNVEQFPDIKFESYQVEKIDAKNYKAIGTLTIRGVSRQIELPFEYTEQLNESIYKAEFEINRRDYQVGGKSWVLSDVLKAKIIIHVSK